jgi:hypothetical protein
MYSSFIIPRSVTIDETRLEQFLDRHLARLWSYTCRYLLVAAATDVAM